MRIRESFWAALGRSPADSQEAALDRVRKAMLEVVDDLGGPTHARLEARISAAQEIAELWHLRPDLMQAVAAAQGEVVARDCVIRITQLFRAHHLGGAPRAGEL